ncbi:hypothetical protein K435DRAFT_795220 [Dendrothele bispora CBS 962.96]|uniref:Uncharacterized protein n=1 Tax=Dendrothele bispora (strain CBS 962.96) TaxID=1314807 RepID=A0A4S8MAV0_DENBC|nr:hypothetical protein K435DRAFT_795220 [Dendrothele bispora CBS 962.96]
MYSKVFNTGSVLATGAEFDSSLDYGQSLRLKLCVGQDFEEWESVSDPWLDSNHPQYAIRMFIPSSLNRSKALVISGEASLRLQAVSEKISKVFNTRHLQESGTEFWEE